MVYMKDLLNYYQHYKYIHFFSICFGLGWVWALYSPFRPVSAPAIVGVGFTVLFEVASVMLDTEPHTKKCKGVPYGRGDVCFGFLFAFLVAILNLKSYHAGFLSHGCGLIMFSFCGAIRKCRSLRKLREMS